MQIIYVDRTIRDENSVLLQEALEPHYIHEVGGERLTTRLTATIRDRHSIDNISAVTGLVRLLVGWLEKLQNRNRFGALIGFQLVGFEAL